MTAALSRGPSDILASRVEDQPIALRCARIFQTEGARLVPQPGREPRVAIELPGESAGTVERFDGTASTARGAEGDRLLGTLRETSPHIAAHRERTDREMPLVVIEYPA